MEYIVGGAAAVAGLTLVLIAILGRLAPEFHATTTIEEVLKEETNDA